MNKVTMNSAEKNKNRELLQTVFDLIFDELVR